MMRYVMSQVADFPMSKPKRVKDYAREAFRVDSKAEGDHVMIGGWEVLDEKGSKKGIDGSLSS